MADSFSEIASAAVVLAQRTSIADACATYIENCTDVESSDISRCLAKKLCREGTIKGAVLQVCGEIAAYPDQLALEVKKVEKRTAF